MRPAEAPWSARAPGRSRAMAKRESPFDHGVQRSWTLRKNTMPVGPQYSTEFGKTSGSMNGPHFCPAPTSPTSPQACHSRHGGCPSSTPTPNTYIFINDTTTTEIYTLSLHAALPIYLLVAEQ